MSIKNFAPEEGTLSINIGDCKTLYVRIPNWLQVDTIIISEDGKVCNYKQDGRYMVISNLLNGDRLEISFNLPVKKETVTLGNEGFKMTTYSYTWVVDTVVKMEPRGKYHHLYNRSRK